MSLKNPFSLIMPLVMLSSHAVGQNVSGSFGLSILDMRVSKLAGAVALVPPHPVDLVRNAGARTEEIHQSRAALAAVPLGVHLRLPKWLDRATVNYEAEIPLGYYRPRGAARYRSPEDAYTFIEQRSRRPIQHGYLSISLLRDDSGSDIRLIGGASRYPLQLRRGWDRYSRDEILDQISGTAMLASIGIQARLPIDEHRKWSFSLAFSFDFGRGSLTTGGPVTVRVFSYRVAQFSRRFRE